MNTGSLGPAVATVLTVYGIETSRRSRFNSSINGGLQQYLPFTVLKRTSISFIIIKTKVATVLTVYGIET
mgnify:CR=1 FL=1